MAISEDQVPGVQPATAESQEFVFNHTMLRAKDPKASLAFYTRVFGMRLLRKLDFPEMLFKVCGVHPKCKATLWDTEAMTLDLVKLAQAPAIRKLLVGVIVVSVATR